ncbi:hypothetical protein, partial [Modicisalibacter xianhensis]|uniref:hypothetical protein n=1 Tax=Modicisalibacter xianhensis TaxID=442341 RepID=UPI001AB0515E
LIGNLVASCHDSISKPDEGKASRASFFRQSVRRSINHFGGACIFKDGDTVRANPAKSQPPTTGTK